MSKVKPVIARNATQLARTLGLAPADAAEMEVRRQINEKIIRAVEESRLTHAKVAKAANTSRSRLTAILNRDRRNVSTDLMLRILAVLGYEAKVSFRRIPRAA